MDLESFQSLIDHKGVPLDESDVRNFELRHQLNIPTQYRSFLKEVNGGHLGGRLWFIGDNPEGEYVEVGINHIGGIRSDYDFIDIEKSWPEVTSPTNESKFLWIMDDPFGNEICIGIRGEFWEKVFFRTRGALSGRLKLVTNTFHDFVSGLRTRDEIDQ